MNIIAEEGGHVAQEQTCTLLHGSPKKIEVGQYLDPAYCGMWENCTQPHPITGERTNALFLIDNLKYALFYARREIYAPRHVDLKTGVRTQYFIFKRPDTVIYVYTVMVQLAKLSDMFGKYLEKIDGEAICFEPVKILERQDYDIQRILEHYATAEKQNTVARILKPNKHNVYPYTFGVPGSFGKTDFDNFDTLLRDLERHTKPIPGIKDCFAEN